MKKLSSFALLAALAAALSGCGSGGEGDANKEVAPGSVSRPAGPGDAAGGAPTGAAPGTPQSPQ